MSTPSIYSDGTITVENGSTAFSGTGTAWSTQLKRGTQIVVAGVVAVVAAITSDSAGTFAAPWPGDSAEDAGYVAETWNDGADIADSIRQLMERLIGKGMGVVSPGDPVAADYRDNDFIFNRSTGVLSIKDMGILRALLTPNPYDAKGDVTADPSERDQYDDGQGDLPAAIGRELTFFSLTEGGFYWLITPAVGETPAVWSDLVSIKGVSASEVLTELGVGHITISTDDPSGGADGDLWFKVSA